MSYILDALNRAEAERQRGAVPGLQDQTQPLAVPNAAPAVAARWGRAWSLFAAGLLVLAGAGGAAWWWRQPPAAAAVPAQASPVPVLPAAALPPSSTPLASTAPADPALAAAPPGSSGTLKAPVSAPMLPPIPAAAAEPAPPAESIKKPAPRPALTTAMPAPAAMRRQDLPEAVRQQLPALRVAGATYSADPRLRMVIINGQVQQEGERVAPGVVLETIRPKEVVLRAQGYRFTEKY